MTFNHRLSPSFLGILANTWLEQIYELFFRKKLCLELNQGNLNSVMKSVCPEI